MIPDPVVELLQTEAARDLRTAAGTLDRLLDEADVRLDLGDAQRASMARALTREALRLLDPSPAPAGPRLFRVVLAASGITRHAWTVREGERTVITDPLVSGLVADPGGWSIEVAG